MTKQKTVGIRVPDNRICILLRVCPSDGAYPRSEFHPFVFISYFLICHEDLAGNLPGLGLDQVPDNGLFPKGLDGFDEPLVFVEAHLDGLLDEKFMLDHDVELVIDRVARDRAVLRVACCLLLELRRGDGRAVDRGHGLLFLRRAGTACQQGQCGKRDQTPDPNPF